MNLTMFTELINNAALLLALGLLYDMLPLHEQEKFSQRTVQQIFTGVVLGAIGMTVMLNRWTLTDGIVFDTRSVLLAISGLFFGTLPTLVAILMTAALRISQGGGGMIMGVMVIVSSGLIGVGWRRVRQGGLRKMKAGELYAFGVVVHLVMLACTIFLPRAMVSEVLRQIFLPVMLIYPVAVMLLGMLLVNRLERKHAAEALRESEERYRTTLMSVGDGVIAVDGRGMVEFLNPVAEALLGWTASEARGRALSEIFQIVNEATRQPVDNPADLALLRGRMVGLANHSLLIARDGTERPIADSAAPITNENGTVIGVVLVFQDQTQARSALQALQESEARYRLIADNAGDVIWILDLATQRFKYVSPSVERLRGYTAAEVLEQPMAAVMTAESLGRIQQLLPIRLAAFAAGDENQRVKVMQIDQTRRDGSIVPTEVVTTLMTNAAGQTISILGVSRDISERKRAEDERKATIDLLNLMNNTTDIHDLLQQILEYLKNWSQCEAVGIRLKDNDDYPYYVSSGFPTHFLRTENRLCSYDAQGAVERDGMGNPILECMCGNVLCGRLDPSKDFFTAKGSFWTNSTTELLASTSEADRQARTRNRCNGEGYESVALIPLRSGKETLGLIQFNDPARGRFIPEQIDLFERLADNIANFLAKRQVEQALLASQERFRTLFEYSAAPTLEEDFSAIKMYFDDLRAQGVEDYRGYLENHPEAVTYCAGLVRVLDVNQESVQFFQASQKKDLLTSLSSYLDMDSWGPFREELIALAEGRTDFECEITNTTIKGQRKHLSLHLQVVQGYEDTLSRVLVSFWDITARKQAEEATQQAEQQARESLKEKEVLLRELYHRTKNNMQVIRAMLVLQSAELESQEVQWLVNETGNKIQAMALVHQMLYQSQNLSSIDLDTYIRDLTHLAISSYRPAANRITLKLELEPAPVTIDIATPLGLILNELLSNAYKHAFPGEQAGEICIRLQRCGDDRLRLMFSDNGIGVPEGFDLRQQKSYGMQSVFNIAELQLGGQVQVDTSRGLGYTIEFSLEQYQQRV